VIRATFQVVSCDLRDVLSSVFRNELEIIFVPRLSNSPSVFAALDADV